MPASNHDTLAGDLPATAEASGPPVCEACGAGLEPGFPKAPRTLSCPDCGLMRLETFPTEQDRAAGYQESYYEEETGDRFLGPLERLIRAFRSLRVRAILRRLPASEGATEGAVLDIGCGRGRMLKCFQDHGFEVLGTQLSETAQRAAERLLGVTVLLGELPALELETERFRVVTLFHLLEHVDRPRVYIREAARVLAPGGVFCVEVPDSDALGFRWLGQRCLTFDHPNHLFFFGRKSLVRLLESEGLKVLGSGSFSLEYSPFTTLQNLLNGIFPGAPNRFYRALMRNQEGRALRRSPLTWLHALVAAVLGPLALLVSLTAMIRGPGNTLRVFARKEPVGRGG